MSRAARITADFGRCDGGFYIEAPDIPEGLTCREWRRRRAQVRPSGRSGRPHALFRRPQTASP
jgi:hypothetical protein